MLYDKRGAGIALFVRLKCRAPYPIGGRRERMELVVVVTKEGDV